MTAKGPSQNEKICGGLFHAPNTGCELNNVEKIGETEQKENSKAGSVVMSAPEMWNILFCSD